MNNLTEELNLKVKITYKNVFVATNDRTKSLESKSLEFMTVPALPDLNLSKDVAKTVFLIDVIWINKDTEQIECAFEIEKSTSIYSGILRLVDLASSLGDKQYNFFLLHIYFIT